MRLKAYISAALLLLGSASSMAQGLLDGFLGGEWPFGPSRPAVIRQSPLSLDYDLDFKYDLHNMEFSASKGAYLPSRTIHTVLLNPSAGLRFIQSETLSHRFMLGIDIAKNMGENPVRDAIFDMDEASPSLENTRLFRELTLYYRAQALLGRGIFTAYAGVFPRRFMQGDYSDSIFSEEYEILDRNLDGLMLQYRTERLNAELGCDWMGMFGTDRREKFQIFSAGEYRMIPWLSAGWDASVYHFACSSSAGVVAYNNMLDAYLRFDLAGATGLDEFSVKTAVKGIYQYTQNGGKLFDMTLAMGAESVQKVKYRAWGLRNTVYAGPDMMPLYDKLYSLNDRVTSRPTEIIYKAYAQDLYTGSPFYHTGHGNISLYDCLELFFQPHISSCLDLRVAVDFHFSSEQYIYAGTRQKISLLFNLDALRYPQITFKERRKADSLKKGGLKNGKNGWPRRQKDYKGGKFNL